MEAFEAGAGMGGQELSWLIAGAILLCAGWILMSAYRGWVKGRVDGDVVATIAVKSVLLILLFLGKRIKWLILPLHESETDRHLIGLSG